MLTEVALIRKVREPFGILSNMSQHSVIFHNVEFPTAEALFQALRFEHNAAMVEQIRAIRNPMSAKIFAKKHAELRTVEPLSLQDVDNMRQVLVLKLAQHKDVAEVLASTKGMIIIEDCTRRQHGSGLFWGAALIDRKWVGENWLGKLWMERRMS